MEGQTSAQPRGTNHPFHKQGFCPTDEDYSAPPGWSCWERAARAFSANGSLRKERPCPGDPLKLSENLQQPFTTRKLISLVPGTPPPTPTNSAFPLPCGAAAIPISVCVWGEANLIHLDVNLLWHAIKAKSKPILSLDRLFLHLCQLLLLRLKILLQHCNIWLNIKQPALGYCEQVDKSLNHKKSHSWSWPTASSTEIYKNALFKEKKKL